MASNGYPGFPVPCLENLRCLFARSGDLKKFHERSPIGTVIERAAAAAELLSLATWIFGSRAYSHQLPEKTREAFECRRSWWVDVYISLWFALEIVLLVAVSKYPRAGIPPCLIVSALIASGARLVDIVQANVNMHVFDGVRFSSVGHHVASHLRSTLISVWNYVEMIGWFAIAYYFSDGLCNPGENSKCTAPGCFDSIYFSAVTQLTIGFGDLKPIELKAKLLVISQGLLGTLFVIFAISRFASLLPSVREHDVKQSRTGT